MLLELVVNVQSDSLAVLLTAVRHANECRRQQEERACGLIELDVAIDVDAYDVTE